MKGHIRHDNENETQKLKSIEISKTFSETNWSKQSVTTYNQARKKSLNQQLKFRFLMSESELMVTKRKAKRRQMKKNFFKFNLIVIKRTAINLNLYLGCVIRPREATKIYC